MTARRGRNATALTLLALATSGTGCASSMRPPTPIARPAANVADEARLLDWIPPLGLALPDDAVVRVVADGARASCSGTLIHDDQVLTAHHCIVERDTQGRALAHDLPASGVSVELGGDYLPWGTVTVQAIIAPPCGYNGGKGDIAVLVLSRKLVGVSWMTPRLERTATQSELVDPIGFGRCALSNDGIHRIRREGGAIEKLTSTAFVATTSICPGDSGGPARSRTTGEVVGVVSAAVMDGDDQTRDPSVFTRLDVWREVFGAARLVAEGSSPSELPPLAGCGP